MRGTVLGTGDARQTKTLASGTNILVLYFHNPCEPQFPNLYHGGNNTSFCEHLNEILTHLMKFLDLL